MADEAYAAKSQRYLSSDFIRNYNLSNNNIVVTDVPGNGISIVTA